MMPPRMPWWERLAYTLVLAGLMGSLLFVGHSMGKVDGYGQCVLDTRERAR